MTESIRLHPAARETVFSSPRGQIRLFSACAPEFLHSLTLEEGIGRFARYRSIIAGVNTLETVAALPDANVTVALCPAGRIIGYVECSYPDPLEGWRDNEDGLCYELGAIEVSRNWRHLGLAKAMTALIVADPFIETKVFFLTGYCWHWDLDQTTLTAYAYRNMLVRLFRPFGFRVYLTTNPEITMSSANVLMARIGAQVNTQQVERFQKMLFLFNN
ncbi:MAG TPA: N-acetyltransferase [Methylomirabilota bacterium]|nr:N-acetyltransferase [Methylomirabilota bacterium]